MVSFPFFLAARVTPTLPKQNRPVREGTRVASVETGLAAAAAKLAQQVMGDLLLRKGMDTDKVVLDPVEGSLCIQRDFIPPPGKSQY